LAAFVAKVPKPTAKIPSRRLFFFTPAANQASQGYSSQNVSLNFPAIMKTKGRFKFLL